LKSLVAALVIMLCLSGCHSETSGSGSGSSSSSSSSESKSSVKQTSSGTSSGGSADAGGEAGGGSTQAEPGNVKIALQDQSKAGIQVALVEVRSMPQLLTVTGQVMMDEQHTSHLGTIADGRITSVYVLPGATVKRGTVLAELHSHMVHETVGTLVQAFAAVDRQKSAVAVAQQAVERYAHLYNIQAASLEEKQHADQMLAQARQDLIDAQANVHMEREHLSELLQVSPESLTQTNLYDRELIPIRSPIDGVVVARNVTVGQVVNTGFEAFAVSNLSTVWVIAALNETDIAMVHNGAPADVITQAYANTTFPAHVAMVGDTLDPQTRTIPVRVSVPNPGVKLRPGMFASAHIDGPKTRSALFIPEDALQDVNGNQVVFVTRDGSNFKAQVVKLGTRSQGKAEVIEGLKPGDRLVVNGAFMVKGELLKGTVGDG
jgi:cobalt-zinc-cadmium efflux system membrane fusion protein